jgi:hypothetical protein
LCDAARPHGPAAAVVEFPLLDPAQGSRLLRFTDRFWPHAGRATRRL